jgi:hypothetical protein
MFCLDKGGILPAVIYFIPKHDILNKKMLLN